MRLVPSASEGLRLIVKRQGHCVTLPLDDQSGP